MEKMTFNEIYKTLIFEKTKLITTKLLCPHNNSIMVISSVKQCKVQNFIIYNKYYKLEKQCSPNLLVQFVIIKYI